MRVDLRENRTRMMNVSQYIVPANDMESLEQSGGDTGEEEGGMAFAARHGKQHERFFIMRVLAGAPL